MALVVRETVAADALGFAGTVVDVCADATVAAAKRAMARDRFFIVFDVKS